MPIPRFILQQQGIASDAAQGLAILQWIAISSKIICINRFLKEHIMTRIADQPLE